MNATKTARIRERAMNTPKCLEDSRTGLVIPVVDFNRYEGKDACVAVYPYDAFEVRKIDPSDYRDLSFVGKIKSRIHGGDLSAAVQPWADLPPIGGSAMDTAGDLYFTNLKNDGVYGRDVSGKATRVISDSRLHSADAPYLAPDGRLWLLVAQLDRLPLFHQGQSRSHRPFLLVSIDPHVTQTRDKP